MNSEGGSYRFWQVVKRNQTGVLGCLLVLLGTSVAWNFYGNDLHAQCSWNSKAVTATYAGAQLRELDSQNAALFLAYDLHNNSGSDFRLADGPGVAIMSRLLLDGNLSAQEPAQLGIPSLVPAGQQARISVEIRHAFPWPEEKDPELQQKLKAFVNERVGAVQEFVLFDEADRIQVNLPGHWQQLKVATAAVDR